MEVLPKMEESLKSNRRRRYERQAAPVPMAALLTPTKVAMLTFIASCRILSLPQLAALTGISLKSARGNVRKLFDGDLVDVVPVGRAALAPANLPNDASLLHGSAPNLYVLTKEGHRALVEAGILAQQDFKKSGASYGPRNALFLAHEVAVNDVRVWLERAVQNGEALTVERWQGGNDATIPLGNALPERREIKPDALFVLNLGADTSGEDGILVSFVETDRGTERGNSRWGEKVAAYAALFLSGQLSEIIGYESARVLIVTPNRARTLYLQQFLQKAMEGHKLITSFWLSEQESLALPFYAPVWVRADQEERRPLIPEGVFRTD